MTKAVERIIADEFTKKAKFYFDEEEGTVSLHNADKLFKTFDRVSATFAGPTGNRVIDFTPEVTTAELTNDFTASSVTGYTSAVANYATGAVQTFAGKLSAKVVTLDDFVPTASVEKLKGNTNVLTVTVTEVFSDGSKKYVPGTFTIDNNAIGTYKVGKYKVYVDTKGNVQIRECYMVW
jgi:hypothetical protein